MTTRVRGALLLPMTRKPLTVTPEAAAAEKAALEAMRKARSDEERKTIGRRHGVAERMLDGPRTVDLDEAERPAEAPPAP